MGNKSIEQNVDIFESTLSRCNRSGMDKLIEYIRRSDFYAAPASTRFHSCHEGGLLEHSLNVMRCLFNKMNSCTWKAVLSEVGEDSIVVSSLLHDLCKCHFYVKELRNKKVYKETGKKIDSNGRYDWESVESYSIDDKIPYGHGEKSVMMIEEFIKLKPVERYAIRWHMLWTEPKEFYNTIGTAIERYPFILALSQADMEATYLLEAKE